MKANIGNMLQPKSIDHSRAREQFASILHDDSPAWIVRRQKCRPAQALGRSIRQFVSKRPEEVTEPIQPTGPENGGAHRKPTAVASHGQAPDQRQQRIRFIIAEEFQRPGEDLRAAVSFGSSMRDWQLRQGGNDNIPEDVFPPIAPRKPTVEELLNRSITAPWPLLFVRSDVRMEERDPIPQGTGNLTHKVCRVVNPPHGLKEQRGALWIRADQTAVLSGQKPRIDERVRAIRFRLPTQVRREHGDETVQEGVPRNVYVASLDMRCQPLDGVSPLLRLRVRRAIEIRKQCLDSGPSSTKHGRYDLEASVLAPPFGADRVVVRNVRHHPCAGRNAPAAVAKNQRMIAEWGASLRRAILQVFHEAAIPTVHRRGRRQEIDHRLCTPIFRLPRYQSADSVKTEVKHAFEKQSVVGLVEVDLAAVKGAIEAR